MYKGLDENKNINTFTLHIKPNRKCQWLAITSVISCICISIVLVFASIFFGVFYYNLFVYQPSNYKIEFFGSEEDCKTGQNILETTLKETYSCKKGFSLLCDRRKNVLLNMQYEFNNCTGKSQLVGQTELTKCVGASFLYSKFHCFT